MVDLTTRNRRRRLPSAEHSNWVRIARGRSLGYRRRGPGAGIWYVRVYVGRGDGSPYRRKALGTADDRVPADGSAVLSYAQAVEHASAWNPDGDSDPRAPITVADAVERYLAWYKEHRRAYERVSYGLRAHVLPPLGELPVEALTTQKLRGWHEALARKPARLRSRKGAKKRNVRPAETENQKMARRSTANRVLAVLKAALNKAWEDGAVESRAAWQRVKPFRNVDRARVRYLESDEVQRLANASDLDFRQLVVAAIYTGARYGELIRLRVEDARLEAGSIYIAESKSGNPRTVYLNDEALVFFESLAAGREGQAFIFTRADASPWGANHQQRRIKEACAAAKIDPPIVFHELRHSYASLYLMSGGGLVDLAKQLGHSTTRMVEKHYGHLADSWRADRAKQFAPTLGVEPEGKVRKLRQKRRAVRR